ncbi:MAG: toxin-antitoxin system YwqK family antitoxin [Bacteroidota bacterium]
MMRLLIGIVILGLASCSGGGASGPAYDLKGFDTENIGGGAQIAVYRDQQGFPLSKGQVLDGVRTGSWTTYHPESTNIKTITNYINGRKTGIEVTLNNRGQVESVIEYKNDVQHGLTGKYKFGRPTEEMTYKDGVLDGPFAIYDDNSKIQRRGSFKDGKQHGTLQFYDDQGNVTLQYEYANGEKISGGIVERPSEEVGS